MVSKERITYKPSTVFALIRTVLDFAIILAGIVLCAKYYDNTWSVAYRDSGLLCGLFFVYVANFCKLYENVLQAGQKHEYLRIIAIFSVCFLIVLFVAFLFKYTPDYSRVIFVSWYVFSVIGLLLSYYFWYHVIGYFHGRGWRVEQAAVISSGNCADNIITRINQDRFAGVEIKAIYSVGGENLVCPEVECMGGLEELLSDIRKGLYRVVFISIPLSEEAWIKEVIRLLSDTTVTFYLVPEAFTVELMHGKLLSLDNIPLIKFYDSSVTGFNAYLKRIEDIAISLALMPVILPLVVVIGALIKLTSRGAVFFCQNRYGIDGKVIKVIKFRTMDVCENGDEVVQAVPNDSRVTGLGRFLRRTSLDEIPQFFNVLAGSMSVIGPRPHAVSHNEQYRKVIDGYMVRHKIKPGITGWAQVNGLRGQTNTPEKMQTRVEYDKFYIENWSVLFDLEILLKTILVVLNVKNVY